MLRFLLTLFSYKTKWKAKNSYKKFKAKEMFKFFFKLSENTCIKKWD